MSDLEQAADALQSFHDLARPKCCRVEGCDIAPPCAEVCDVEAHRIDHDAVAEEKADRADWKRDLYERSRRG